MGIEEYKRIREAIDPNEFKLNSLLEITKSINYNKPVEELLEIYNFILKEQLHLRKFVLYNLQDDWKIISKVGVKGKIKDINIEKDILKFKSITVIESSHKTSLNNFDVIIPVLHKDKPLAYLFLAGLKNENSKTAYDNLNFIQTLTNIIVVAIENKRLANESIKQERVKQELEVASEMQRLLFPSDLPSNVKIHQCRT